MNPFLLTALLCGTLSACGGSASLQPAKPASSTSMVDSAGKAPSSQALSSRAPLGLDVLPATASISTIHTATVLLQRPRPGSGVVQALNAGDTVQLLGILDNADGQWASIGVGDVQGWVRASEITP